MEAREAQYKQAAEEMAVKFKEKLNRQKEKLEGLQNQIVTLKKEKE